MNGITYYRLKSDYPGDYTKNCALNGTEVDNNFYVLEGRDVKSIAVKGKDIILTLLNGDTVIGSGAMNFVKPEDIHTAVIKVEFDKLNGVLKLTNADGTIQHIEGFATNENTDFSVATDNTLCGEGLRHAPLGVAPSAKTGQFKTVKSIINIAEGGNLPKCGNLPGDRYVTCEDVSDYGYLYDYRAIRAIACELKNSGWRIPTKADWDDLLNAIEPCDCDKTHDKADKNKFLGKWAGKLLKSKTMWKECCCDCDDCCDCDGCHHECDCHEPKCGCETDCDCGNDVCFDYSDDPCVGTKECESECKCEKKHCGEHKGLDAFGFRVTPAGYADDGCNFGYFKERSAFWTATTNSDNTKAYSKRFQFNKDGVYQDVIAGNYHLSLRLIKDYNGKNYHDVEEIMDLEYPTLLLPSVSKGKAIWTSCNFACGNASLCPMLPNNGQGLTYTRHYFINEWNGFKWVRNEMKQGDTVTIAAAPKGKKMVEYRVVGNEFISVNEMIYDDVMADVQTVIDNLEEKLTDHIEQVEVRVENVETRVTNTETRLDNAETRIEATEGRLDNAETRLENAEERLTNTETRIQNAETRIEATEGRLDNAETRLENAEERLTNDETRIEATEGRLDDVETRVTNTETRIQNAETRIEATEGRLDNAETRIEATEGRLDNAETRIEATEGRLDDVETRIEATEGRLDNAETRIENVEGRVTNAETRIENVEGRVTNAEKVLIQEIADRKAEDERIEGKILSQEGTEFDSDEGVLTLKSAAGTNDITVQFSFNFGTF